MSTTNQIKFNQFILSKLKELSFVFIIPLSITITIWYSIIIFANIPIYFLPTPINVWREIQNKDQLFLMSSYVTIRELIGGLLIAIILGWGIGTIIGTSNIFYKTTYPILIAFQSLPKIALAPLVIIWFGIGLKSNMIMASILAFYPIVVGVQQGFSTIDADIQMFISLYKPSRYKSFTKIQFPIVFPHFLSSMRIAIPASMVGAIIGEIFASNAGLGYLMMIGFGQFNLALVFGSLIFMSCITLCIYIVLIIIENKTLQWQSQSTD